MKEAEEIVLLLSQRRYALAFAGLLAFLLPVMAVSGAVINPWTLEINLTAEPAGIAVTGAIAALMAGNGAAMLRNMDARAALGTGSTALGTAAALFTSACPICQPIWLVWLGLGSATAFLAEYGIYIGLLSVAMLALSLRSALRTSCEVKLWKR
ncbi:MAG: hypothetical protein AB1324_00690 [Candidatus Micrarchaeota archaeon]